MPHGILRFKYREGCGLRWFSGRAHGALWLTGCGWGQGWGTGSVEDAYQFFGMDNWEVGGTTH